jgi:hypothetical protein
MDDLIKRIKEKCAGHDRWYVMSAAEDGYCMDFDWQLEADRWMADRLRESPEYIERNGYHIVKQRSLTEVEKIANEAADALEAANSRIAQFEAARIAYASEFAPDAEGLPDVGSIHANIRALKRALTEIAEQEHIELMLDPTWAQRVAVAALAKQQEPK